MNIGILEFYNTESNKTYEILITKNELTEREYSHYPNEIQHEYILFKNNDVEWNKYPTPFIINLSSYSINEIPYYYLFQKNIWKNLLLDKSK